MADIKSLFLEDAFTFHVGPAKKAVKIPPSLLTKHSAPLKAMISNGMKETKKKVATLPDEEPETVGYFLEWAVNGVYRVTETKAASDVEQQKSGNVIHYGCTQCHKFSAAPTQVKLALWCSNCKLGSYIRCSKCNRPATVRSALETDCTNVSCTPTVRQATWVDGDSLKVRDRHKLSSAAEEIPVGSHKHKRVETFIKSSLFKVSVTGNLLAHAKVYVFAEKYLIKELGQMACHLLHREILDYSVEEVGSVGIVGMIEYAYQNSGDVNGSNSVDSLKHLALRHAAVNSDKLLTCKGFCNLLREGGEFAVDFAKMQKSWVKDEYWKRKERDNGSSRGCFVPAEVFAWAYQLRSIATPCPALQATSRAQQQMQIKLADLLHVFCSCRPPPFHLLHCSTPQVTFFHHLQPKFKPPVSTKIMSSQNTTDEILQTVRANTTAARESHKESMEAVQHMPTKEQVEETIDKVFSDSKTLNEMLRQLDEVIESCKREDAMSEKKA